MEVNAAFARHSGFGVPLGRTITELMPGVEPFWFDAFGRVVRTGEAMRLVTHVESLYRWFDVYAFLVEERDERKVAVLFSDVTEQKRAELPPQESVALLRYHANHDARTGLPNRLMFEARLLPELSEPHEAGGVAEKLLGIVSAPIEVVDTTVRVHASIGVGMYPKDGTTARAVLRAADAAMYSAKAGGKNAVGYVIAATAAGARRGEERTDPAPSERESSIRSSS